MAITIAFTGHRPKDLPQGFTYPVFAGILDDFEIDHGSFIAGGALGVDTWAAEYAIQRNLPLHLHLPFVPEVMSNFWSAQDRATLDRHIAAADSITIIHPAGYDVRAYQLRNESMVNASDVLYAVWTGKPYGGTANCIRYAQAIHRPMWNLLDQFGN